jgi:hypothetical protein
MILIEVLSNEMGLKSDTFERASTFGTRVICDPFILSKQTEPE